MTTWTIFNAVGLLIFPFQFKWMKQNKFKSGNNVHSINSGINWGPHSIPLANKSVLCSKILNELLYLILFKRTFNTQYTHLCRQIQIIWVNAEKGTRRCLIINFSKTKQSVSSVRLILILKKGNLKLVPGIPFKLFVVVLNLFQLIYNK